MQWITFDNPVDYSFGVSFMEKKVQEVINGNAEECIILLEHKDVYTAGTSYRAEELLNKEINIPIVYTGRGGKFTYHGKGQLVIYPILNLNKRTKDIKLYIRNLEEWIIETLKSFDIDAYIISDLVGIWVKDGNIPAKIAAIGIRVKKWVTYHGIAVNITTNLDMYNNIIPCGIKDFSVTSLERLGIKASVTEFASTLKTKFEIIF